MIITYYGHATFLVEVGGSRLLFDPFISGNPMASNVDVDSIEADYILVSHGHQDHVLDVESIAKRTGAKLISNFEIITWFAEQGVDNGHPMNHGGQFSFNFGSVKYVNAIHSSVLPDGTYGGNPGGFVVRTNEGSFYYAGDTALTMDMKLIETENIQFSMLPIGDNFTMGVEDAITCCDFIGCGKVFGMHYDTFPPIAIDKNEARNAFRQNGKELTLLEIGQSTEL